MSQLYRQGPVMIRRPLASPTGPRSAGGTVPAVRVSISQYELTTVGSGQASSHRPAPAFSGGPTLAFSASPIPR